MSAGGIRRRCRCRDEDGKDLGAACPKLTHRSHGTYQVRHELLGSPTGQRRTFRREGFTNRKAAQDTLDRIRELLNLALHDDDHEAIASLLDGLGPKDSIPNPEEVRRKLACGQGLSKIQTVGGWLDEWQQQKSLAQATEVSYESHTRLYLKPKIGDIRLDRLTVSRLVEMFNSIEDDNDWIEANNADRRALLQQVKESGSRSRKRHLRERLIALPPFRRPVGPSSQQRIRATLRAALNDAIAQQLITFNPAAHVVVRVRRPKPIIWIPQRVEQWRSSGLRPGPVMVWTPAQAGAFLDYVAEHDGPYEALWHLMVFRGPRRGEVAGLPWTETHLDTASIEINTQRTEVAYKVEEGVPKSTAGERTIPLDAESVRLLKAHRKRQLVRKLELGTAWVDSGKVFCRDDGTPLRPSWIGDQFTRLCSAADLPPIRLHDLRHVAATLMLAANVDMKVVQETLGHSTLSVTSDVYTSVLPELAQAAAEAPVALVPRAHKLAASTLGHPTGTRDQENDLRAAGGENVAE